MLCFPVFQQTRTNVYTQTPDTISHETGRPFIQDTIQETEPKWGLGTLVQMGSLL